ncbi:hypothetical protein GQ61_01330 [Candidatus Nucleicultrix amoebiphila FS5]|uniref:Outer membrane protein assembly factor BamA n=2 Tax=Candidatus Nucleicultrix TaxID=1509243 RepID=A0A1W6N2U1_9PROT|nr:hypothetical protein GQ61_01330 [Candidatus Nucleicultrix amoebiphila FS5]
MFASMHPCTSVIAQEFSGSIINQIEIEGNKRIHKETIVARQNLRIGNSYTKRMLDDSLKSLYATEWFEHVTLEVDNGILKISVVENPTVNQVGIEGNNEISDEIIKSELKLKPLEVFTSTRVKNDTKRVQDLYRLKGYFSALVTPKVVKKDQNRVDVVFEVQEGEATKVSKIFFIGNKKFNEGKLESVIQTKESRWYRFFTSDAYYDPDRLGYDRELLRKFYLEHGYADFRVKSAVAELTPDQKEFFITFTIEEGERYTFGDIEVASEIEDVKADSLKKLLTMSSGDWYNSKLVEKNITLLTDSLGNSGYAFVDINPKIEKDEENHIVKLTFQIEEGPRVYINKIIIIGNTRTDEDVIRREFRFYEGDAFNTSKLKDSEKRLKNLGHFKDLKIKKEPTLEPDKIDIIVDVEEERTGELSVGGGFSTIDGPLFETRFNERNFRGRGQDLSVSFTLARRSNSFDIGFTEPYFLNRELAAGIDLYRTEQKQQQNESYRQRIYGTTLRLGYRLTEDIIQKVYYSLRRDEVFGISQNASRYIKEQAGINTVSAMGHDVVYDQRDSALDPTEGYFLGFGNDLAGVGGTVRYFKTRVFGGYFYPVHDDWVLAFVGRGGMMNRLGKNVRIVDRFALGGDSLRGFEIQGVGPRDLTTNDSMNGLRYFTGTAELTFPVGLPNEFSVKGAVFTDVGSLWYTGESNVNVVDKASLRAAVGAGIRWKTPFLGTIRVDFAKAVKKEKYDRTQFILFGFSTRF